MPVDQPRDDGRNDEGDAADADAPDLSAAAHQLRAPLTAIIGYADLLQYDGIGDDPEKREEIAEHIVANAQAESQIIDDYLDQTAVARELTILSLRTEIESLIADIAPTIDGRTIDVDVPVPSNVTAESGALREILTNLITNAVKYGDPSAPITISSQPDEHQLRVVVHNEGNGLVGADLHRIFRRGVRASDKGPSGSGLGLNIAEDLVDGLGGRIWAELTPTGTSFAFTLPSPTT